MSATEPRPWGSGLPAAGDDAPHYEACVTREGGGRPALKQTTGGGAKTTAAWLRALADEIDPPRRATRGTGG